MDQFWTWFAPRSRAAHITPAQLQELYAGANNTDKYLRAVLLFGSLTLEEALWLGSGGTQLQGVGSKSRSTTSTHPDGAGVQILTRSPETARRGSLSMPTVQSAASPQAGSQRLRRRRPRK